MQVAPSSILREGVEECVSNVFLSLFVGMAPVPDAMALVINAINVLPSAQTSLDFDLIHLKTPCSACDDA
eukprot:scaffold69568_cov19-Tisochrysis_lutea.AAC.1